MPSLARSQVCLVLFNSHLSSIFYHSLHQSFDIQITARTRSVSRSRPTRLLVPAESLVLPFCSYNDNRIASTIISSSAIAPLAPADLPLGNRSVRANLPEGVDDGDEDNDDCKARSRLGRFFLSFFLCDAESADPSIMNAVACKALAAADFRAKCCLAALSLMAQSGRIRSVVTTSGAFGGSEPLLRGATVGSLLERPIPDRCGPGI